MILKRMLLCINICALILSAAVFTGCDDKTKARVTDAVVSEKEVITKDDVDEILTQYNSLLLSAANERDVLNFIDENIYKMDPEGADALIRALGTMYRRNLPNLYKTYAKLNESPAFYAAFMKNGAENFAEAVEDETARQIVEETYANGYTLAAEKGLVMPLVDTAALEKYEGYTTKSVTELLNLDETAAQKGTKRQ